MSDDSLAKIVDSLVEERKSERKFKLLSRDIFCNTSLNNILFIFVQSNG